MDFSYPTVAYRLRCALQWHQLRILLIADTLIATLLAFLAIMFNDGKHVLFSVSVNFIFTHAIGTSIYFLTYLTGLFSANYSWRILPAWIGTFMLGGWLGTLVALGIIFPLFGTEHFFDDKRYLVLGNTFLAVFFGSVVFGYYTLRRKLENTAARLAEKEVNEHRILNLKAKAELEALRAKINPHFLFNTLNSIASLIPVDPHGAEEMVQKLARLFRHTLDASNREVMTLAEELQAIREYLEVEKVRLGERLTYEIKMDDQLAALPLPGMLLQPLVENSVKHGISPSKTGGHIFVSCTAEGERCKIEIMDTGQGFDHMEITQGFGLNSVRERLTLHYGDRYEFNLQSEGGVQISLSLPFSRDGAKSS